MDFGRSRHAFGIYVRRAVRLGLSSVCACRRPLACAGARFGTAGHFARSSVGRQDFTRLCVSFSIYIFSFRFELYFFFRRLFALVQPSGHTHPSFEGRTSRRPPVMFYATGFSHPGSTLEALHAPPRVSSVPTRAVLLAPSWVGPTSEAKRLKSFGVRSCTPARFSVTLSPAFLSCGLFSSLSEWTAVFLECLESWECWWISPWRAFRRAP